ncbi:MAG TPA: 2-C-methyl-D-erythritol 4-phosphate cytidylyltransferase, partial [bacterium]|nr:2-C-methyl-D-erythritol 4-phosphate cytidylyltransferase [bacterium]
MRLPRTETVVVAAGRGARIGAADGKAFVPLRGQPLVLHTLRAVEACPAVEAIVAVVPADRIAEADALIAASGLRRVRAVVAGGPTRQASVAAGLARVDRAEIVLVHDGARPLVRPAVLEAVARAAAAAG